MMRQPGIGGDFTTWAPLAIVPYMLLLGCGVFNRVVGLLPGSSSKIEFEDDWENKSSKAAYGLRLLKAELIAHQVGLQVFRLWGSVISGVKVVLKCINSQKSCSYEVQGNFWA